MRVAITRPHGQAEALAARLAEAGIDSLIEPLLDIVPRAGATVPLDGASAILVTSANGAGALAAATERRDLPVYAVGESSAAAARAAGFAEAMSADGDVHALAALVARSLAPDAGALVHACGSTVAGDLAGMLEAKGFQVRRAILYDARPAAQFSDAFRQALEQGALDAVVLFSPRTAAQFARLVDAEGLREAIGRLIALCLSEAVAAEARRLDWAGIAVSRRPSRDALVALLVAMNADGPNMCGRGPAGGRGDDPGESRT